MEKAQKKMKKQFDKKRRNPQEIKDMDHSKSRETLDQKHLNWSFQKDG